MATTNRTLAALIAVAALIASGCADLDAVDQVDGFGTGGVAIAGPTTSPALQSVTAGQTITTAGRSSLAPTPSVTSRQIVTTGQVVATSQATVTNQTAARTETSPPGFSEDCIALGYLGHCSVYSVGFDQGHSECRAWLDRGELVESPNWSHVLTPEGTSEFYEGYELAYLSAGCSYE